MGRSRRPNKNMIRQLKQYQDLSEKDFDVIYDELASKHEIDYDFEHKILKKWGEYEEDYDFTDLKANDKSALRALIQAEIALEELTQQEYRLRLEAVEDETKLNQLGRISQLISYIRGDISRLQDDLNITRRVRKGEKEESVLAYIDKLHKKTREFVNAKFGRIYCPECKMLIGSVWALYPDNDNNKFWFYCGRKLEDGTVCGARVIVTYPELINNGLSNIEGLLNF